MASEQSYVLMTAAHNEEALIERTITSVLSQTVLPKRWVIVSDNSSDRTDEIVQKYARRHDFIRFLRIDRAQGRHFGAKVLALRNAGTLLEGIHSRFVGNLDGDISLEPWYFERLMAYFERDPSLGIAAGYIHESRSGQFRSRPANRQESVPHAAQLVRRECYEAIGGYAVLKYGGEDWHAQVCARMEGWGAQAIPKLKIFHHRPTGAGTSLLRSHFRLGRLDYSFGSDPVFEFLKCARRLGETPQFLGACCRFLGFASAYLWREPRPVSDGFIRFLRHEQRAKILASFSKVRLRRK